MFIILSQYVFSETYVSLKLNRSLSWSLIQNGSLPCCS